MSWDGGWSGSRAIIVGFRNGNRIVRVSPDNRPGKTMGKSDALSWRADHGTGMEDNQNVTLLTLDLFAIRALEGLEASREEKDLLKQIRREMEMETHKDLVVKAIKELKKSPAKSVVSSEWSMEHGLLRY